MVAHSTRATLLPGSRVGTLDSKKCPVCERNQWRSGDYVVIANVYEGGKWNRLETIHVNCYREGNETHPAEEYGPAGTADEYARALSSSGMPRSISVKQRD